MLKRLLMVAGAMALAAAGGLEFHRWRTKPGPGRMLDEARLAGRSAFAAPAEDYFHGMDDSLDLALEEIRGRNTWMVWSAGNDRLWDWLARESSGTFDLLKIASSYDPAKDSRLSASEREKLKARYPFRRENRLAYLGLSNEPCYDQAVEGDPRRFGLWLDVRQLGCVPDPFTNGDKYPGVPGGARGRNLPLGSSYGEPSGVVGLRLFANPDFRGEAVTRWDPVRYYTDPAYYESRDLVRPYRVGVTCAFCHAGPNPGKPAEDPKNPEWANLSATAGARNLRIDRIAFWAGESNQFLWQMLHAARPGTVDLSLIATDQIDNPRPIRPIRQMAARMEMARAWGRETLGKSALANRQMSNYVAGGPLASVFEEPATVWTPRLGTDAMDSVGILGAVNRAFPAMGMFSEEMLLHFNPLVGGKAAVPVDIAAARRSSGYWQASEEMAADVVRFLMRVGETPVAPGALTTDHAAAARGRVVFADRCAACHSSKFPPPPAEADPGACSGNYLDCWNRYWAWTRTEAYRQQMRKIVLVADFVQNNYLSNDLRVPLPLVGTNACVALSGGGTAGGLWSAFTSETYQKLPSAGTITYYHPGTGEQREMTLPGGGRGYLRPPSLAGLWTGAPYLHNNSVGASGPDLGPLARMAAFHDGMQKLLWPERREKDERLPGALPGRIERTTAPSRVRIPARMVPEEMAGVLELGIGGRFGLSKARDIEIGPVPDGTPVDLLANLNLLSKKAVPLLVRMKNELRTEADFAKFVDPLFELSTCPDFVVNRGHYFGTGLDGEAALSDQQKNDLIAFLATL